MQALNRQRADEDGPVTYSNTNGRFVTVDICGTMGLWNTDMQLQKSVLVSPGGGGGGGGGAGGGSFVCALSLRVLRAQYNVHSEFESSFVFALCAKCTVQCAQ